MTTYSFINQEYTDTFSGNTSYLDETNVYTVPSGKVARIKFDSVHLSTSANLTMDTHFFMLYSDGTNIHRKHTLGLSQHSGTNSDQRTISYYDPKTYPVYGSVGGNTTPQFEYSMSASPQGWVNSGTVDTTPDNNIVGAFAYAQSNYGSRVYGPSEWYMGAGEVLKAIGRFSVSSGSGSVYHNIRLVAFLEDT